MVQGGFDKLPEEMLRDSLRSGLDEEHCACRDFHEKG